MGAVLAAVALLSLAAPAAWATGASCPDMDLVPAPDNLDRVENALLCVINHERAVARLVPLKRAQKLDRSAVFHTVTMVRKHFFAHEVAGHPSLLARVRGYGYFAGARDGIYAENVGAGPSSNGTARALMEAWMQSPDHRANLMHAPFRDVGIAAVLAPPDPVFFANFSSTVYTTDFGTRYVRRRCVRRRASTTPRSGSATPRRRYCRRVA
jgi:uncharacterized protein YkwD